EIGCVDITLALNKAVSGRYVQYRFEGNSNWMMIAEVEAFKTDAPPAEILLGDVNRDTKVDSVDYLLVKRACFGTYKLDEEQIELADIDQNKIIDSVDYLLVKRIAFGTYKA
ncbi:MAG: dockerin type I repeat-containing protein, partial [Clostridia bacterium]|nr:dockerin type I repeat-containing protein [Clostridia bacterium]